MRNMNVMKLGNVTWASIGDEKCQMVQWIHRTNILTVGQPFYRWQDQWHNTWEIWMWWSWIMWLGPALEMRNVRWSSGSIVQTYLPSDNHFTDGKTNDVTHEKYECDKVCNWTGPAFEWQMSNGEEHTFQFTRTHFRFTRTQSVYKDTLF